MLRERVGGLRIAMSVLKGVGGLLCAFALPPPILFLSAFAQRPYACFKRVLCQVFLKLPSALNWDTEMWR